MAEFCRSEAVSVSNFYVWKKRLEATSDTTSCSAKGGTAAATFLPLVVRATGLPDTVQPTLKLLGGAAIELPNDLEACHQLIHEQDHINDNLARQLEKANFEIEQLKRYIYGRRSECLAERSRSLPSVDSRAGSHQ